MPTTKTLVYAGKGSSHSWTWLADMFESNGILGVRFLDSHEFISSLASENASVAIVSGGDGFVLADALRGQGFRNLGEFILKGGVFVGICAGAYLPLPSSVEPFSGFNISTTKIENIRCQARRMSASSPREAVTYGNCSIVHPVRGPIEIADGNGRSVVAPLYGGPVFKEPKKDVVMMRYKSFTPATEFQLDRALVEAMMLKKPAVIRVIHGDGSLVLFAPHLEHPQYPQANRLFLRLLGYDGLAQPGRNAIPVPERSRCAGLNRSISDLKVAVLGLENRSFTVGHKSWDGSRLLEIVSAIEKRGWTLTDARSKLVASDLGRARDLLVGMKAGVESDADETTSLLVEAARTCVDNHFAVLLNKVRKSSGDRFGDSHLIS
jgi:glutamine amidotransferase-like uncharacterized protein